MARPPTTLLMRGALPSPLGALEVLWDAHERVRVLDFADNPARIARLVRLQTGRTDVRDAPVPGPIARACEAYFAGDLAAFASLAWQAGGTPFQRQVWQALTRIPAGTVRRYGELARTLGRPEAARAVGHANGANPIAILLPCHRLVGADGRLTGYAGGLARKRWLLEHEGVDPDALRSPIPR